MPVEPAHIFQGTKARAQAPMTAESEVAKDGSHLGMRRDSGRHFRESTKKTPGPTSQNGKMKRARA